MIPMFNKFENHPESELQYSSISKRECFEVGNKHPRNVSQDNICCDVRGRNCYYNVSGKCMYMLNLIK